jgi:hypothetical protein
MSPISGFVRLPHVSSSDVGAGNAIAFVLTPTIGKTRRGLRPTGVFDTPTTGGDIARLIRRTSSEIASSSGRAMPRDEALNRLQT